MLGNTPIHTTIAVTDIGRAKKFYCNTLGLQEVPGGDPTGGITLACGHGTHLYLYPRGEPSGSTATCCSWEVENVESTVKGLQKKGVAFEEYDLPDMGLKTNNGVATMGELKAAWFKDPDGNILAVSNNAIATKGTPQTVKF